MIRKFGIALSFVFLLTTLTSAASYAGDGQYSIREGDQLTTENGYTLKVDDITPADQQGDTDEGTISIVFDETYTTSITEGEEQSFQTGVRSTKTVARMEVPEIDQFEPEAEVIVKTGEDDQEEPQAPPGEDSEENGNKTFSGPGTYTFTTGDRVTTGRNYSLVLTDIVHEEMIGVELHTRSGEAVSLHDYRDHTYLSEGSSRRTLEDYGITAVPENIDKEKGEVRMRVSTTLEVDIKEGWNLISFPLSSQNTSGTNLVQNSCQTPLSEMNFYTTEEGKYTSESPKAGKAYWLKSEERCSLQVQGEEVSVKNQELKDGWNMIGSPTKTTEFSSLSSNCNVESGPWSWDPNVRGQNYFQTSQLQPGEGYFIKIDGKCSLGNESPPSLPE